MVYKWLVTNLQDQILIYNYGDRQLKKEAAEMRQQLPVNVWYNLVSRKMFSLKTLTGVVWRLNYVIRNKNMFHQLDCIFVKFEQQFLPNTDNVLGNIYVVPKQHLLALLSFLFFRSTYGLIGCDLCAPKDADIGKTVSQHKNYDKKGLAQVLV